MSKYFTDSEEIQKAIILLEYVNGKLASLSKRINTVYSTLNEQQNSTVKNANNSINVQGIIYDDQMKNIVEIAGFLQATLNESLIAQEAANKIMESEIKQDTENHISSGAQENDISTNKPSSSTNIVSIMKSRYQKIIRETGRSTFDGLCGAFVFQQLRVQGIVEYDTGDNVTRGKDYYVFWKRKGRTSTGYRVETYGGTNGLRDLLATRQGQVIRNVAVSFNYDGYNFQSDAGHVLLISEIRDNKVYFMENKAGTLHNLNRRPYAEGEPLCLSVNDFIKQYPNMNGVAHFIK